MGKLSDLSDQNFSNYSNTNTNINSNLENENKDYFDNNKNETIKCNEQNENTNNNIINQIQKSSSNNNNSISINQNHNLENKSTTNYISYSNSNKESKQNITNNNTEKLKNEDEDEENDDNEEYEEDENENEEINNTNNIQINKNNNNFLVQQNQHKNQKYPTQRYTLNSLTNNQSKNNSRTKLNPIKNRHSIKSGLLYNSNNIINSNNKNHNSMDKFNTQNTKKYVLSSVRNNYKTNNIYSSQKKNINQTVRRPKSTSNRLLIIDANNNNNQNNNQNIVDYTGIYNNFNELFSGYFLSTNYSQSNNFNLNNVVNELYESFNRLFYYEANKNLMNQKDEMYSDIVRAEAGVIINRIKHAQEKLLKEPDIESNIEKYIILKKCLELEKRNYTRVENSSTEINEKKFFRVVLSRPEIYDIVCYTLYKDSNWSELPHGLSLGQCWNLYWSYGPPNIEFNKLFSFQKVNHLINNRTIHRKDLLQKHIMRVRKLNKKCDELFNIMPLTFLLSKEYVNFVEEFHKLKDTNTNNIWIVKPVGKSRGKGIFLINDISDVPLNDTFLVQKYLEYPLLLDAGYKFDLRLYCLVTSVNPLEMFLYKDGFARVSNEIYSLDINNIKIHLTNAAIQNRQAKHSNNFEKVYGGSKISLNMLSYKLKKQYNINFDNIIWPQVKDIITKVFICCQNDIPYCPSTFEMFGFDIIIDSNFKCWLLEINSSPSLERSNVLDDEIKLPLVSDIIKIVDPMSIDKMALLNVLERNLKIRNRKSKDVYLYSPKIQLNMDLTNIFKGKIPRKYGEVPKDMGRFEMICPTKETDKLIKMAGGQKFYNNKREKEKKNVEK